MTPHILIAYASRAGSTAGVAEAIGQILREGGAEVDVRSVNDVSDAASYDAVVLGTAIWVGKPLPEAVRFAGAQQGVLADRPVAYFALCDTLRDDTPENRERVSGYLDPLVRITAPVSIGLFAGARDFSTLNPLLRWLLKNVMRLSEGDWRDWGQIRAWAAALPPRLVQEGPALAATA